MKRLSPVLLGLLIPFAAAAEMPAAKFGSLAAGTLAPDFTTLDASGREIRLSDFKDKVVVVNLWATNRGPADVLESAFSQYQPLGVTVLGICSNATREEFDAWLSKHKRAVTYPLARDPAGKTRSESIAQKNFGLGVFPATLIIDRTGKFVGGFVGFGATTPALLRGHLRDAGVAIPPEPEPSLPAAVVPPAPRENHSLKPGSVAPDFASLRLDGQPVSLSDFAGKIVVLDFWATWCGPCIASMPHTQKVAAAAKSQGVVILAACTSDTRAKFESWLRENGAKFPDLIFANDPNGRDGPPEKYAERASAKLYGVSGIPCQFVIGRDGKIAEVISGYGPQDTRLEEALAQLGSNWVREHTGRRFPWENEPALPSVAYRLKVERLDPKPLVWVCAGARHPAESNRRKACRQAAALQSRLEVKPLHLDAKLARKNPTAAAATKVARAFQPVMLRECQTPRAGKPVPLPTSSRPETKWTDSITLLFVIASPRNEGVAIQPFDRLWALSLSAGSRP